ncbi:MAG: hypothetical protein ACD_5C00142G0005 [uncultured bacterium]|nr:MAG: hypothetical protein ACD_5C00142G0005 [uncultured bacterium]
MGLVKSNLEPIEEKDLDLEGRLRRADSGNSFEQESIHQVEREVPQEISAAEKDDSYGKILSKVQTQNDDIDFSTVVSDAQSGAAKIDAETQVQHLVDLASQKGVVHAVKVAQHMQDNYILDTFHDRMLGQELHDALVKKGMIKEI